MVSPIMRMLEKHVGMNWDKVWSEICQTYDGRSDSNQHLKESILRRVHLGVTIQNGNFFYHGSVFNPDDHWAERFWVHPETNILMKAVRKRSNWSQQQTIFEIDGCQYYRHEGIWYRVKFKECPDPKVIDRKWYSLNFEDGDFVNDVFLGKISCSRWSFQDKLDHYGKSKDGKFQYAVWKQSSNSKEIAKLNRMIEKNAA